MLELDERNVEVAEGVQDHAPEGGPAVCNIGQVSDQNSGPTVTISAPPTFASLDKPVNRLLPLLSPTLLARTILHCLSLQHLLDIADGVTTSRDLVRKRAIDGREDVRVEPVVIERKGRVRKVMYRMVVARGSAWRSESADLTC